MIDELTIHVFLDSEGNYQYSIYDCAPEDVVPGECRDGGVLEMGMSTALGMAIDHTRYFLRRQKQ